MDLKGLLRDHKLFVDTSSLMFGPAINTFIGNIDRALTEAGSRLIVPRKVIEEVEKHLKNRSHNVDGARRAQFLLKQYQIHDLLDIRGEKGDSFADNVFLTVFTKFRLSHNLALITQDRNLAAEILALANSRAVVSRHTIHALRLDDDGQIHAWKLTEDGRARHLAEQERSHRDAPQALRRPRYTSEDGAPAIVNDRPLSASGVVEVGTTVQTTSHVYTALGQIGHGAEGSVFDIGFGRVAKIYHGNRLTSSRRQKLERMLQDPPEISGVCWPIDLAFNSRREWIGYIMQKAYGVSLRRTIFAPRPVFLERCPGWDRSDLVTLAITFLEKIERLHHAGVLIGDINPLNIMLESSDHIWFVDTDSYQIERFACPVGMINFTAPEIQGKDFRTFLRQPTHEYFAIATMLFMILLPGKPPYSQQGGGDPVANIKSTDFSYPLAEKSNRRAPAGSWRYVWSNLPYRTKEAFYECFRNGKRLTTSEWLQVMHHYRTTLLHGRVTSEIFPDSFKAVSEHAENKYGARKEED